MRTILVGFTLIATLLAQTSTPDKGKAGTAVGAKAKSPKASPAVAPVAPANSAIAAHPIALFDTSKGKIACELFPDKAPKTVANFIGLANGTREWKHPFTGQMIKNRPLYDNTNFHRVIPNFMIQGGDPIGNGTGDPGYRFEDEFSPDLRFDQPGRLAMANSGPGTNGSQFFITEVPTPHLNDRHTIFGQCDQASVDLVSKIARVATDPRNNMPLEPVKINHITIVGAESPGEITTSVSSTSGSGKTKSKARRPKAKSKSRAAAQPK